MSQEQERRQESPIKYEDVFNVKGEVTHQDASNIAASQGVSVTEIDQPVNRTMNESNGGWQVVEKDKKLVPLSPEPMSGKTNITIGEALEATGLAAGGRPIDYSDAAAIQAAEVRATGRTNIVPDSVAAAAQSAATHNARASNDQDKTKLGQILSGVIGAELRNDPNLCTRPGGVAASIAAAAKLNQNKSDHNEH